MTGALLNTATVLVGASLGLLLGSKLPERGQKIVMRVLGVVTLYIGGRMTFDACKTFAGLEAVVLVISLAVGIALGSWLKIQTRIERAAQQMLQRFTDLNRPSRIAEGWVSTSLLFCVGPMTIIGSLQDGLTGDYKLIATKAALDGIAAMGFAASLGWGVLLSALTVLLVQGGITLGAHALEQVFTPPLIAQCGAAGGVLVVCIGISLTGIKKLPVADYLPAIVLAPLLAFMMTRS